MVNKLGRPRRQRVSGIKCFWACDSDRTDRMVKAIAERQVLIMWVSVRPSTERAKSQEGT